MWRRKRWISGGLVAVAVAAAVIAGLANGGKAASTNTCTGVDCFSITVAPIYFSPNGTGLVTAKFRNISGSATATHTVISVSRLIGISATSVSARYIFADGTSKDVSGSCSQPPAPLSCSFGNVAHNDAVEMLVQVNNTSSAGTVTADGTLSFAEGNGGTNDTFTLTGSALSVSGSDRAGYCTTSTTKTVKNKTVPLISTVDGIGQTATIESLKALASGPCTPIAAGVESTLSGGPHPTHVSVVAFPATGTVTLLFPLSELGGLDASTFDLYELSILPGDTSWIKLLSCPTKAPGTDSCITSKTNVTMNGTKYVQIVLTVDGQPPDGHYGG
jgi:hypothetical protein